MIYTVYLDMLFLVNFFMDTVVLLLVKKLLGYSASWPRILLGSGTGALWVCLITVFTNMPAWLENVLTYVLISSLMMYAAFRPKSLTGLLKTVAAFYMTGFAVGGLFYAVYAHTRLGYYISLMAQGSLMEAMPVFIMAAAAAAAYFFYRFFWEKLLQARKLAASLYQVTLYYQGKSAQLMGLLDTGNGLWEPISKSAVHVVCYEACAQVLRTVDNLCYVPYQAVGTKEGVLPAVVIDKMSLTQGDQTVIVEKPMLAVYRQALSANGRYQMLIHPAAIEQAES